MNFSIFTVFLKNRNIISKNEKIKSYRLCSFKESPLQAGRAGIKYKLTCM